MNNELPPQEPRKDEDFDAEIRSHLDEAIRDRIAYGSVLMEQQV